MLESIGNIKPFTLFFGQHAEKRRVWEAFGQIQQVRACKNISRQEAPNSVEGEKDTGLVVVMMIMMMTHR